MPAEATENLQSGPQPPATALFELASSPGPTPGTRTVQRRDSGFEFTALLAVMLVVALYSLLPTENDLASLQSALLYAVILNSN